MYLVRFVPRLSRFRLAEFLSVCSLYGVERECLNLRPLSLDIGFEVLPSDSENEDSALESRWDEIQNHSWNTSQTVESGTAATGLAGGIVKPKLPKPYPWREDTVGLAGPSIFQVCNFPSDQIAFQVGKRCVLVKSITKVIGVGRSYQQCSESCLKSLENQSWIRGLVYNPEAPWKLEMDAMGIRYGIKEKQELYARLADFLLKIEGKVSLKNPKNVFVVHEYRHPLLLQQMQLMRSQELRDIQPDAVLLGYFVVRGFSKAERLFDVAKRCYISTTSMEAKMAVIMANLGKAAPGSIIFDPFVGTASVLLPCAYFGAYTFGSDVQAWNLTGRSIHDKLNRMGELPFPCPLNNEFCTIEGNFKALGNRMRDPMFLRADDWDDEDGGAQDDSGPKKTRKSPENARALPEELANQVRLGGNFFASFAMDVTLDCIRPNLQLDAIVCDPPYGIRETFRSYAYQEGSSQQGDQELQDLQGKQEEEQQEEDTGSNPQLMVLLNSLLQFASRHLLPHGRLVYFIHVRRETYSHNDLPKHAQLRLVHNCEQVLGDCYSRRLVVMEKV